MVQVDIVWSYAFGASFAAASARTLEKTNDAFQNRVYTRLLLFLSILFAPSGIWLLSAFPRWETMQVADQIADIPPWLMTLFALTNVTQGVLGYYVGYRLARKGKYYAAHVNTAASWILFWFILVCGWDTTGWQRFLYDPMMNNNIPWAPGMYQGPIFFVSPIFLTLLLMGIFFVPSLFRNLVRANYEDLANDNRIAPESVPRLFAIMHRTIGTMFTIYLLLAIAAYFVVRVSVAITGSMLLGYLIGLPIAVISGWQLLFRHGRPMHRWLRKLYVSEPNK